MLSVNMAKGHQNTCIIAVPLIRGVRRIGLTSLNPKVCPSNQSESDPKIKKSIPSDPIRNKYIRSDPTRH